DFKHPSWPVGNLRGTYQSRICRSGSLFRESGTPVTGVRLWCCGGGCFASKPCVRGGERLGHFSGPFRATPFPLVEDLRTVLAVKGSLRRARSEEHTSELQSRSDLVCRLL